MFTYTSILDLECRINLIIVDISWSWPGQEGLDCQGPPAVAGIGQCHGAADRLQRHCETLLIRFVLGMVDHEILLNYNNHLLAKVLYDQSFTECDWAGGCRWCDLHRGAAVGMHMWLYMLIPVVVSWNASEVVSAKAVRVLLYLPGSRRSTQSYQPARPRWTAAEGLCPLRNP